MNDLQKFAHNIIEALKPLDDAINQLCGIGQKHTFELPPGMCKNVNAKGMAGSAALIDPMQSDMGALRKSIDPSFRISWHLPDDCDECTRKKIFYE